MKRIVDFSHDFIRSYIHNDSITVDFTMGKGSDTIFLATCCPQGHVYSFDIVQEALDLTQAKLNKLNITNVSLILDSHHHLAQYVSHYQAGIFNFGYLPGSDTYLPTFKYSLEAVSTALELLDPKGILILVLYPGHNEGLNESQMIEDYIYKLDHHLYNCFKFNMIDHGTCPYIIGVEKKLNK